MVSTYGNRGVGDGHACAEHVTQAPPCEPIDAPCAYCGAEPMERCAPDCLGWPDYADENGDLI